MPELIFVTGPNAAGKSSFIRTRINDLPYYKIIMTDVYKGRSKEMVRLAIQEKSNIILETVFNDDTFKDIVDEAKNAGYTTSLVVLFLDSIQQSIDRVAFRSIEQSGLVISSGNARINFNENFKNVAYYFFYFDSADFIYTGITGQNQSVMRFQKSTLIKYLSNELLYPQKFAQFAYQHQRVSELVYNAILANTDFED